MKSITLHAFLLISLIFLDYSRAEEKFDPAARAKDIASYIDENTFVVVYIDVTRVKLDRLDDIAKLLVEDSAKVKLDLQKNIDVFLKAGCKELYIICNSYNATPLVVIPLPSGADDKAIHSIAPAFPFDQVKRFIIEPDHSGTKHPEIISEPRPELAAAFEAAGDMAVQVVFIPPKHYKRVFEEIMPQLPKEVGGGESAILTKGCLWAALGVDLPPQLSIKLVVQSQDAAAATALRAKWIEITKLATQWWMAKDYFPNLLEMSQNMMPAVEDNRLVFSLDNREGKIDKILADAQIILEKQRENTRSAVSRNNLWQIGGALLRYYDANKQFPAAAIYSKDGKPLLSWRVAILPHLGLNNLYKEFHLDEPWDSPHNIKLSSVPVAVYLSPIMKNNMTPDKKSFLTTYVVPVGPGTVFEGKEGMTIKEIKDGTSKTIMAIEVDDDHAVIWTKPDDLPYDPKEPAKGLSKRYAFYALFCDGHINPILSSSSADDLRAWFSAAGGEQAKGP